jgi:peptidoglycan/LPS O-acetylase OafA/YrhL
MPDDKFLRIPSLDGLRTISIVLVLLSHGAGTEGFPIPKTWLTGFLDLGNLGVRVFFVISGFLITDLLLKEYINTGRVNLKQFYIKRFFRIFPAFYIFMAVITFLVLLDILPTTGQELLHAWTYTGNYQPRYTWSSGQWYVGHIWSLAVEEQFYLLLPGIFFLGGRDGVIKSALGIIVLAPCIRLFYSLGAPLMAPNGLFLFLSSNTGRSFETVGDAIAIGCLLAILRDWLWGIPAYRRWIQSPYFFVVFLAILICGILDGEKLRAWSDSYAFRLAYEFGGVTAMNICIAMVLDRYMRFPDTFLGRLLNIPAVAFVGILSYSIYLWQQPFLYRYGGSWVNTFPINIVGVILFALASYYLVERPSLNFRKRVLAV